MGIHEGPVSHNTTVKSDQKKLKIAMIAPPWLSIYPGCYYGIENFIHYLTSTLTKQGHHVELFTVSGTTTPSAKKYWYHKEDQYKHIHRPWYQAVSVIISHILYSLNIIREIGDFDIIHDHNSFLGPAIMAYAANNNLPPVLHTLHEPFTDKKLLAKGIPDNRLMFAQFKSVKHLYFNGVSNTQIKMAPKELKSHIMGAIHNGVDVSDYPFLAKKHDYFLSVARISKDKGQAIGARLCNILGENYKMAGTIGANIVSAQQIRRELKKPESAFQKDEDFKYFRDEIARWLKPHHIEYIGTIFGEHKLKVFSEAKGFLFPITWQEPFGMAVIDALACGTPVIAFRRGALPEIINHGVNGFLARNEKEFTHYMKRIGDIDPAECRKSVEKRFSAEAMTLKYVKLYREIIATHNN